MTMPEHGDSERFTLLSSLAQALDLGQLSLAPNALGRAAVACDRYIDAMLELQKEFSLAGEVNGFGNLPSGRAIALHFTDKQREMGDVLGRHIEVATRIKAVFTDAAQRYSAAHDNHVAELRTVDTGR